MNRGLVASMLIFFETNRRFLRSLFGTTWKISKLTFGGNSTMSQYWSWDVAKTELMPLCIPCLGAVKSCTVTI